MDSKEIRSFLLGHLRPHKNWLILSIIFGLFLAGITLALVHNLKPLMDEAFNEGDFKKTIHIGVVFVLLMLGDGVFSYFHRLTLRIGVERALLDMRNRIFQRILVFSQKQMAKIESGKIITLLFNDTYVIRQGLHIASDIIKEPLTIVVMLGYLIYLNWKLTIFCIVILPLIAFTAKKLGESSRRNQRRMQLALDSVSQHSIEAIQGLRTAHAYGRIALLKDEFNERSLSGYQPTIRQASVQELIAPITKLLFAFAGAGIIIACGYFIATSQMTTGEVVAYIAAAFSLPAPVRSLNNVHVRLQEVYASAERILGIINEENDAISKAQIPLLNHDIANRGCLKDPLPLRFTDVSFTYSDDVHSKHAKAVESISFSLEPGKKLALVGPSGSGKSTLSLLIMRYLDPANGKVLLGAKDARDWSIEEFRSNFSYVSQDVFLFSASMRDNLRFASPGATDEELWSALEQARLKRFVEELPQQLDTPIQERASNLSGGEKQRIAIARAILRNAPIVILDEATSQLDIENERLIQQAMNSLVSGKSVIIIAHRLSTVKEVDEILVMDHGRVIERGSPKDLVNQSDSWFSRMWSTQGYS